MLLATELCRWGYSSMLEAYDVTINYQMLDLKLHGLVFVLLTSFFLWSNLSLLFSFEMRIFSLCHIIGSMYLAF